MPSNGGRSGSGGKVRCDVCDVALTSAACMKVHIQGKTHKKKAKSAPEIYKPQAGESNDNKSSNEVRCDVCDVPLPSAAHVSVHVQGQKHQRRLQSATEVSKPALELSKLQAKENSDEKGVDKFRCDACGVTVYSAGCKQDHLQGRRHKETVKSRQEIAKPLTIESNGKKSSNKVRCDVCNVPLTSAACLKVHIQGRKHRKKAMSAPEISKPQTGKSKDKKSSNEVRCDVCDVPLPSATHVNVHVQGHKHQSRLQSATEVSKLALELSKLMAKENSDKKGGDEFRRDVCVKDHLHGQRRKETVGSAPETSEPQAKGSTNKRSHIQVRCDVCDMTLSSAVFMDHLKGKTHKKNVTAAEKELHDPINHRHLLTTLNNMASTLTGDEVLDWLAGELLVTPEQQQQRDRFRVELQTALRSRFRTCLVQAFGSSVSGLGFRGCDLDLYAHIDAESPGSGLETDADDSAKVMAVARVLRRQPLLCTHVMRIPHARVPILKFKARQLGDIECDMSCRDPMSCQNSRLIGWLMKADRRARPVTVAIRYWAKRRRLAGGDHHPLKMSSYCLTLMVVTFLQQLKPPVLPSVDWCQAPVDPLLIGQWNAAFAADAVWCSANTTPAIQLLRQFFQFYAEFAAEMEALCPLLGGPLPRSRLTDRLAGRRLSRPSVWTNFCDLVSAGQVEPLAADTALVLQDPMELNYNVARNFHQLGLQRFRECCRDAASMPLARLFDEQALPKLKAVRKKEKAAAAAAKALAAVSALDKRSGNVTVTAAALEAAAAAALIDTNNSGSVVVTAAAAAIDAKTAKSNSGGAGSSPPAAGSGAPESAEKSARSGGGSSAAAGAVLSVASDPALLQRVLADLKDEPSHIISVPLAVSGSQRPRTGIECSRHAVAFARFLEEVFSVVMRFECRAMTFDDLNLTVDVVRGYMCSARLPTWECRKIVTAQLVGRQKTLQFESEVTERALRMAGQPAPSSPPLATFSCYLMLEGDHLRLCVYELQAVKAGKNCYPFLAPFLLELAKRVDYVTLFGEDLPKER